MSNLGYALRAFSPLKHGKGGLGNISQFTIDPRSDEPTWQRTIDFVAGSWTGSFHLYGHPQMLTDWFYNGLGRHIEEIANGEVRWSGLVWTVDLVEPIGSSIPGVPQRSRRRRRTLDGYVNRVKAVWQHPDDDTTGETTWAEESKGIATYGKFEDVIFVDADSTIAGYLRDDHLAQFSSLNPELVGIEGEVAVPRLEIVVSGYAATAQARMITTDTGAQDNISDWVSAILNTDLDSDFFTITGVDSNTRQVYRFASVDQRVWETLEDLVTLRGPNGEYYQLIISPDRVVSYREWTRIPIGFLWQGAFTNRGYDILDFTPRRMDPGIYRDRTPGLTDFSTVLDVDPIFLTPTDFLVESVEVDSQGKLNPRLAQYSHEEALRSFAFNEEEGDRFD